MEMVDASDTAVLLDGMMMANTFVCMINPAMPAYVDVRSCIFM